MTYKESLQHAIGRSWPASISHASEALIISPENVYHTSVEDSEKLFAKAKGWIEGIHSVSLEGSPQTVQIVTKEIHDVMIRAIFGSNQIERAGLNLENTVQLCRKVLADESVDDTSEEMVYKNEPALRQLPPSTVLRSRNEVIQHAKAYQYIIHAFVVEKKDLDEELIKQTRRILTTGVPLIEDGYPDVTPEKYGGIYRTVIVGAGTTNFTVPRFVPQKMKEMCEALKTELRAAEDDKHTIDPFSVASKYSLQFVQIHPFQDGNGRMCRMILNTILCRYAGIIVPIGEHEEERKEYMGIKRRSSEKMKGHGEYATFVLQRATTRLREMKKKIAGKHRA